MQQNAIAIFVKTPELSPVKTRLTQTIGAEKTLEFYYLCLNAVQEITNETDAKAYWAVGEKEGLNNKLWNGFDRLYTGEGGLGERQSSIYNTLKNYHHNVMLLGADCPQLTPEILQNAFLKLQQNNYVIGPATDGGYYLLAGKRPVARDVWVNIPYSTPQTYKKLVAQLKEPIARLQTLTDIDKYNDLEKMLQEMPENPNTTQKALITWAKDILTFHRT